MYSNFNNTYFIYVYELIKNYELFNKYAIKIFLFYKL